MRAPMRCFLTGATGYIGKALCLRLRTEGHEMRALVRSTSRSESLQAIGVTTFAGDIRDRASLREGMSGADWVIHAAAELSLDAPDERMAGANVEGSENVASLAYKLGVGRLLSVSSVAVFGGSPADGSAATEETPPQLPYPTRYAATKAAGQARIAAWAKQGLRVNTIYPSLVYGPPGKKQGANALLRSLQLGRFPALVEPAKLASWIYLDDLVEAVVRILERAPDGRDYLLAGEARSVRQLTADVARWSGVRAPRRELSARTAKLLFRLAAPWLALTGRRLPVPLEQLDSLERHWNFDDSRARRELAWTPRGLDEGLPVTLDYLRRAEAEPEPRR